MAEPLTFEGVESDQDPLIHTTLTHWYEQRRLRVDPEPGEPAHLVTVKPDRPTRANRIVDWGSGGRIAAPPGCVRQLANTSRHRVLVSGRGHEEQRSSLDQRSAALHDQLDHAPHVGLPAELPAERRGCLQATRGAFELDPAAFGRLIHTRVFDGDGGPLREHDQ